MTIINGIMEAFEEAVQTINVEEEDDDQDECPAELLISQEKLADLCAEVRICLNSPKVMTRPSPSIAVLKNVFGRIGLPVQWAADLHRFFSSYV